MKHTIRFSHSIYDIGKESWDALSTSDNPFLRFEFLAALEDCQCIDSPIQRMPLNSGWIPQYAIVEDEQHAALAIAPCLSNSSSCRGHPVHIQVRSSGMVGGKFSELLA